MVTLLCASKFGTTTIECSFEMDKWTAFGLGVPFILLLSVYLILKKYFGLVLIILYLKQKIV